MERYQFKVKNPDPNKNLVFTKESLMQTSDMVSELYKRTLTIDEVSALFEYANNYPPVRLTGLSKDQAIARIAKDFAAAMKLQQTQKKTDTLVNSYQKRVLAETGDTGYYNVQEPRIQPNEPMESGDVGSNAFETRILDFVNDNNLRNALLSAYKNYADYSNINFIRHQFNLDSRFRVLNIPNPLDNRNPFFEMTWDLNYSNTSGKQGTLRIPYVIQDVIQMRLRKFWFPVYLIKNYDNIVYYKKIRVLIEQFSSQSVVTDVYNFDYVMSEAKTSYHHFECDVERIDDKIECTPVVGTFETVYPIKIVERITLRFFDPYNIIEMLPDRGVYLALNTLPAVFPDPPSPFARIGLLSNNTPNLQPGDLIYLNVDPAGLNTPTLIALYQALVTPLGIKVVKVGGFAIADPDIKEIIEIDYPRVDLNTLQPFLGNIEVVYANRRINMEIQTVSVKEI